MAVPINLYRAYECERSRSRSMHLHGYSSAFPRIRTNHHYMAQPDDFGPRRAHYAPMLQQAPSRRHHVFASVVSYPQCCGGSSTYPSCALPAHALPIPHAPRAAKVQNELKPYRPARPVMLCVWFQNTSDGPALAFPAPDLLRRLGQSSSPAAASR